MGTSRLRCVDPSGFYTAAAVTHNRFVVLDTSECTAILTAVETAGAGGKVFGISGTTSVAGGSVAVFHHAGDICMLMVDGDSAEISVGDRLKSDASGYGVPTTTDTEEVGAVALAGSTGATDLIPVFLVPYTHPLET